MDNEEIERGIARLEQYANKPVQFYGIFTTNNPWPTVLPRTRQYRDAGGLQDDLDGAVAP